jgi:ribosomal protein S18 acetylase RimI-like enzyme
MTTPEPTRPERRSYPEPTIRRLREREAGPATAMLVRAFVESPLIGVVAPDPARRDEASRWMLGSNLRYGLLYGEVWAALSPRRAVQGAAIWWAPAYVEPDDDRSERSGLADGLLVVGPAAWGRLAELSANMGELHHRAVHEPHWYLALVGVDPAAQRQGIAGKLLQPMLDRLDEARMPAYLETGQPRNVAYYPRFGFEVAGEFTHLSTGLTFWGMRRDPR